MKLNIFSITTCFGLLISVCFLHILDCGQFCCDEFFFVLVTAGTPGTWSLAKIVRSSIGVFMHYTLLRCFLRHHTVVVVYQFSISQFTSFPFLFPVYVSAAEATRVMAAAAWRILLFAARIGRPRLQQWLQWLRMKHLYKTITEELWYASHCGSFVFRSEMYFRSAVLAIVVVCTLSESLSECILCVEKHAQPSDCGMNILPLAIISTHFSSTSPHSTTIAGRLSSPLRPRSIPTSPTLRRPVRSAIGLPSLSSSSGAVTPWRRYAALTHGKTWTHFFAVSASTTPGSSTVSALCVAS